MTRYFIIAALLGVFAFASVSFLAQAQEDDDPVYETEDTPKPAKNRREYQQAQVEAYVKAKEQCQEFADSREPAEYEEDPEAAAAAAFSKCMKSANYSDKKMQEIEAQVEAQQ